MKLVRPVVAVIASFFITVVTAETVVVDGSIAVRQSSVPTPARGMSMDKVEAQFGQPSTKRPAVGEPPITRWDYPGFSVFFEHQIVLHAVTTGSAG